LKSSWISLALLAVLLAACVVVSLAIGPVAIPAAQLVDGLTNTESDPTTRTIVWELRLPRSLLAALVGFGLGVAGAGYQGLFRNPLADPFVIGASSGAALGATLAILGKITLSLLGLSSVTLAALAGALSAVAVVYTIANTGRQAPTLSLLLAGVAVSSFLASVVAFLLFISDQQLISILGWIMGSFSGRGWTEIRSIGPLILFGALMLWWMQRALDSLAFGEEAASSLGLPLARTRGAVVLFASLTTAAGVAAGGIIGFVGLIAPHVARRLVGARHAVVIPASGLLGALLLVAADDVARTAAAPAELPVGIVTALLGSPFFLFVLKRTRPV